MKHKGYRREITLDAPQEPTSPEPPELDEEDDDAIELGSNAHEEDAFQETLDLDNLVSALPRDPSSEAEAVEPTQSCWT